MNDHINTILPIAWQWLELEQLIVSHDGKRVPVRKADRDQMQGDIPYYGASGIIDYVDSYLFDGNYLLLAEDGANLLSRSKPIAFQAHGQFWVNNHAHIFQTKGEIPLAYLEHYLNSFHLARFVTGTAQPKLTKRNMNRIPVPVAPLEEQKRIVAEIETQFARLDQVVASLERLRVKLKQYRASVLKAACEGRLVPQDPNDEPADVLLARILKERRRKWEAQAWQKEIAKAQKKAAKATRKANGNPFKRGDKLTDVEWRDLPEAVYKRYLPKNEKWKEKYQEPKGVGDTSKSDLPLQWAFLQINSVAFVTKLAGFEYTKFVNYTPSG
ncbi:MAG: restriction endonuclease subunit S, partial [Candidatus Promineifilaceae bacterium]